MAGDIFLGGTVRPGGPFPIVLDTDLYGGYRVVPDLAARDAIFAGDRKFGMAVFVQSVGAVFVLDTDLVSWDEIAFNSVISNAPFTCPPSVVLHDVVYVSGSNTVDKASAASAATIPAIGVVITKPTATTAVVLYQGEVSGFSGLTPGAQYYVSLVAGAIVLSGGLGFPSADGQVIQAIGRARSSSRLIVSSLFFLGL